MTAQRVTRRWQESFRNLWFRFTSDYSPPLSPLEHVLFHQAGAAGGEGEGVNDELLPALRESDQLVVEVLLAPRLDPQPHHPQPALLAGNGAPRHPHQLDVLLVVAALGVVDNEPELPVLVLGCPGHYVLRCQPTDVLKTVLVQFLMFFVVLHLRLLVGCITTAFFSTALEVLSSTEPLSKNRVVDRDAWVETENLLCWFPLLREQDLDGLTLFSHRPYDCLLGIIRRL